MAKTAKTACKLGPNSKQICFHYEFNRLFSFSIWYIDLKKMFIVLYCGVRGCRKKKLARQ